MEVTLRKMGNSQGILIPKPILAQVGLEGKADLQVRHGIIEIRPKPANPREGWEEDARQLGKAPGNALVWPEFGNVSDKDLTW